ncbi:MAG TPA: PEGA domain-containing protein [Kofleriaceae bacterium]|nr:PEGA domain-containing protein [Kofleriaceae bacterium]
MRLVALVCASLGAFGAVHAQPTAGTPSPALELEVDDCPAPDEGLTRDELIKRGGERFDRGNTLYLQGDYTGSVRELVGAYCTVPFYSILKDIGQSYERLLEYEKAIGYLQRYADAIPADAKRTTDCAVDPQIDKQNTLRRIEVLKRLDAHVFVETTPPDAQITIQSKERRVAYGQSGKAMLVGGGAYEMIVEKVGHQTVRRPIEVKIGKPYTYYVELKKLEGRLSIQTTPADARVFLDKRFVGVGRAVEDLPATKYKLLVEATGRVEYNAEIEVLPNRENRLNIELQPKPQFGRRQLVVFSAIGASAATGSLLYAFEDTSVAGLGSIAGIGAGLLGSYLFLPEEVPLGTANLTITASLGASLAGFATANLFTDDDGIIEPILGTSTIIGAIGGYYFGQRERVSPGDAALLNSTMLWGTVAGLGFALSFGAGNELTAGLVLSGVGMGSVGGLVMTRYYEISRTHAALIDVGGIVGMIGGLAAESLVYREDDNEQRSEEHAANFALGGMAIGLITAGVLTRDWDDARVPLTPQLGTVRDANGASTATFGVGGQW